MPSNAILEKKKQQVEALSEKMKHAGKAQGRTDKEMEGAGNVCEEE